MNNPLLALWLLWFNYLAVAQAPASAGHGSSYSGAAGAQNEVLSDRLLEAELTTSIDAGKAKPGDAITARFRGDVLGMYLEMLPIDSILIGRVIEAHGHSKAAPNSKLAILFDKARRPDGSEIPLNLVIQHIDTPDPIPQPTAGIGPMSNSPAQRSGGAPNNVTVPAGAPDRGPAPSMSGPRLDWDQRSYGPASKNPSGLPYVELVRDNQDSGVCSVLVSSHNAVRLYKHYRIYLELAPAESKSATK